MEWSCFIMNAKCLDWCAQARIIPGSVMPAFEVYLRGEGSAAVFVRESDAAGSYPFSFSSYHLKSCIREGRT